MKGKTAAALLLVLIIGNIGAVDIESYQFIDRLLNINKPGEPELFEDGIIFTAPASNRRVGIAFAHEGFSKVYWFQRLLVPRDLGPSEEPEKKPRPVEYRETGVLFYVYTPPDEVRELAYRLIIDGLWSADPLNPRTLQNPSGFTQSVVSLPRRSKPPASPGGMPGVLSFSYRAPPGEKISVGGTFNGWDPFMYELRETSPGLYTLSLALPPGTYHYVFFHRGEHIPDPNNQNRVYTREGKMASEAVVK